MQKLATAVAVSLALASSGAFGLGLGDIEMRSALNQPLEAEIELRSIQPGELDGLIVQLASTEAFERAGIEKNQDLMSLKFSLDQHSNGTYYIKVGSQGPVTEPFLNFLLEVDWPKGRMVREYTILLDPPVFLTQSASSGQTSGAVPEATSQSSIESDLSVPTPIIRSDGTKEVENSFEVSMDSIAISSDVGNTKPNPKPAALDATRSTTGSFSAKVLPIDESEVPSVIMRGSTQEVASSVGSTSKPAVQKTVSSSQGSSQSTADYKVKRSDTLWEIALKNRPSSISVQQMMLALLNVNKNAFTNGNVNQLKAGAILRMPTQNDINLLSKKDAISEMVQQNRLWQEYRDGVGRSSITGSSTPTKPVVSIEEETPVVEQVKKPVEIPKKVEVPKVPAESELSIVGTPNASDSTATANSDESERPETSTLGQFNTNLALAQEDLAAEELRKEELVLQAEELEVNHNKMERLIDLRENEMAQLQAQIAEASATADDVVPEIDNLNADDVVPAVIPDADMVIDEIEEVKQDILPGDDVEVIDELPVIEMPTPSKEPSFFEDPMKMGMAVAGGLGLLGIAGWLFGRKRKETTEDDIVEVDEETFDVDVADFREEDDFNDLEDDDDRHHHEVGEIQDFDDTHTDDILDDDEFDQTDLLAESVDDESSKDDTISEAEVYLAYGLHGQAEELLTKAVDREPENQEYQYKLLETYHGQKDTSNFSMVAQQFHSRFGGNANPAWAKIAELGRDLDTDNSLYVATAGAALAGAAAVGVDALSSGAEEVIDTTQSITDFDATGDLTEVMEPEEESLLDQSIDPGLVFEESELEATGDFSAVADELEDELVLGTASDTIELSSVAEVDSEELPDALSKISGGASDAIRGAAASKLEASIDLEGDLDLDEDVNLGDLGDLEELGDPTDGLDSMLEGIETDGLEDIASVPLDEKPSSLDTIGEVTMAELESGNLDFDESEIDLSTAEDVTSGFEDMTSLDLEKDSEELMLDIEDLMEDDKSVSLDSTETLDAAFDQTQELEIPDLTSSADLTASDDSAAFGSTNEMETMLDLAKAYIDMGDNESASSALGEIIKDGSEEQKITAKELLKKMG